MSVESEHPELDKMRKASEESQAIGEFVDWMQQERRVILDHLRRAQEA